MKRKRGEASPQAPGMTGEEQREAPAEAGPVKLTHPLPLSPEVLVQTAIQLKTSSAGGLEIEDFFPRAYQLLCKGRRFLGGTEPRELAFIDTNGRRPQAGEGIDYSKVPKAPELKFDPSPANLEASCEMLRSQFKGIELVEKNPTLAEQVGECHKAIHRDREARKELLRAQGEPDAFGTAKQSYEAFARDGLVFVDAAQIWFLGEYLKRRKQRVRPELAEQRVLSKRKKAYSTPAEKISKKSLDTR